MTTLAARDILQNLNEEQRRAVEAVTGPVLIIAGPGSGKTRVITHRIAYLVRVLNVNPRRILAVTFTNRAAREMRSRVEALIGERANRVTLDTFHALGVRILRDYGEHIGVPNDFVIYDEDDQRTLMKRVIDAEALDPVSFNPAAIQNSIRAAKSNGLTVADHAAQNSSRFETVVNACYDRYEEFLQTAHAVDFDDLLLKPLRLLRSNSEIREKVQNRYAHVMVDEWQDTSVIQYELITMIAVPRNNLCVVGDPDQSIYSWRFAEIQNFERFRQKFEFEGLETFTLGHNYRSTSTILDAAHALVSKNEEWVHIKLSTEKSGGAKVTVEAAEDDGYEAHYVAGEIEQLTGEDSARLSDVAIMYRTNAQSRALEDAFNRAGIRYRIVGGLRFWERREVKDVVAYLRVLHNPYDNISLLRIVNVPTRGIGRRTLDILEQWADANGSPIYTALQVAAEGGGPNVPHLPTKSQGDVRKFVQIMTELSEASQKKDILEFFDQVLESIRYRAYLESEEEDAEDRLDNIDELRNVAAQYQELPPGEAFGAFLDQVALSTDLDAALRYEGPDRPEAVTLITLHQAKGMECPIVFIVGVEEELLPHFRSLESGDPAELEEERRLCYVGMTRAMDRLYMTHALRRNTRGVYGSRRPSRFLKDLPQELIKRKMPETPSFSGPVEPMPTQQHMGPVPPAPYRPGDHVGHATFGQGVVVACLATASQDDFEVTVAFKNQGVKRLLAGIAALEKLA